MLNAQKHMFVIGGQRNIDIYKPYNSLTREFINSGGEISSSTFSFDFNYIFINKNNWAGTFGVIYQRIDHRIVDYNDQHQYWTGGTGIASSHTYYYSDPLDLISVSESFGIGFSLGRIFPSNDKFLNQVSLNFNFFPIEKYRYYYYSSDINLPFSDLDGPNNGNEFYLKYFTLSAFKLNVDYKIFKYIGDSWLIGAKVCLGTNLYSDWDQFKRYAWLGVGLELGFGKPKVEKE